MEIKCNTILISGIVQGVGFRYSTNKMARRFGVKGYVKNLPDGRVEILAEGSEVQINNFIKWCYDGPSHARVSNVEILNTSLKNLENFSIKY